MVKPRNDTDPGGGPLGAVALREWATSALDSAEVPAELPYELSNWPIATSMLPFAGRQPSGESNRDAGERAWRRVFDEIRVAGFERVEVSSAWIALDQMSNRELVRLREVMIDSDVRPAAVGVVRQSVIHPDRGTANTDTTRRFVDAASVIGASHVSLGLHDALSAAQLPIQWFWTVPDERDTDFKLRDVAVQRIQKIADHARGADIDVSVETYEGGLVGSADLAVSFADDVDRPNMGINPDLGNLIRAQSEIEPWEYMAVRLLPRANYWHVKNYSRVEDPLRGVYYSVPSSLPGGVIDYRRVVRYALAAGFRGSILCEHYGGDGLEMTVEHQRYLRGVLERARSWSQL